jgi:hypothetical protein
LHYIWGDMQLHPQVTVIPPAKCRTCRAPALAGTDFCVEHEAERDEKMLRVGWKQPKDMLWANGMLPGRRDFSNG